jgi:hypothetical protein
MGIPDSGGSLTRVLSTVAKTTSDSVCSEVERVVIRLFDEHRTRLLRYVLLIGLPVPDAEEIVQDVFSRSSGTCSGAGRATIFGAGFSALPTIWRFKDLLSCRC